MKPWSRIWKNYGDNWPASPQPNLNHTSILEERNMQEQGGYRRDQLKNKLRDLTSKERARCTERIGISSILRLVFLYISIFLFFQQKTYIKDISFSVQQLRQQQQQQIWFNSEEREWDSVQVSHYKSNKLMHSERQNFPCKTDCPLPTTGWLHNIKWSECSGIYQLNELMIYTIAPALPSLLEIFLES